MVNERIFREFPLGTYHALTAEDHARIARAAELKTALACARAEYERARDELAALSCDGGHLVFDTPGYIYDTRECVICGKHDLI